MSESERIDVLVERLKEIARHLDSRGYAHGKWIAHARAADQAATEIIRLRDERDDASLSCNEWKDAADDAEARAQAAETKVGRLVEVVREAIDCGCEDCRKRARDLLSELEIGGGEGFSVSRSHPSADAQERSHEAPHADGKGEP